MRGDQSHLRAVRENINTARGRMPPVLKERSIDHVFSSLLFSFLSTGSLCGHTRSVWCWRPPRTVDERTPHKTLSRLSSEVYFLGTLRNFCTIILTSPQDVRLVFVDRRTVFIDPLSVMVSTDQSLSHSSLRMLGRCCISYSQSHPKGEGERLCLCFCYLYSFHLHFYTFG